MDTEQITDVTADTFDRDVLQASAARPVVVDFWAPWCGPCHQLSPIIERVAARHAGEVSLVKLNVDEAPAVSQRFGIQGIPAVKAFRDGRVVAEFTGVQPEPAVEQLFAGLLPSEADLLVRSAVAAPEDEQEPLLRRALSAEPGHREAVLALARRLVARGEGEEARALLARIPADDAVRTLQAEVALAGQDQGVDLDALRAAAAEGETAASLQLGRALAAKGEHEEAVEHLLAAVGDPDHRAEARVALLDVFAVVGEGSDLVRAARPRLAAALF